MTGRRISTFDGGEATFGEQAFEAPDLKGYQSPQLPAGMISQASNDTP